MDTFTLSALIIPACILILLINYHVIKKNKYFLLLAIELLIGGAVPFIIVFKHEGADGVQRVFEHIAHVVSPQVSMSNEEIHSIAAAISKCWGVTDKDKDLPIVKLLVRLNPDASIKRVGVTEDEKARYDNDPVFKATADRAINDLKTCGPLTVFPKDKYILWEDLELTFDPRPEP